MATFDDIQKTASELCKQGLDSTPLSSVLILTVDDEKIGFAGGGNPTIQDCERIYRAVERWKNICNMQKRPVCTILCTMPEHNEGEGR